MKEETRKYWGLYSETMWQNIMIEVYNLGFVTVFEGEVDYDEDKK